MCENFEALDVTKKGARLRDANYTQRDKTENSKLNAQLSLSLNTFLQSTTLGLF
jgi:hypothetical protein